jgi:hypothetical protein
MTLSKHERADVEHAEVELLYIRKTAARNMERSFEAWVGVAKGLMALRVAAMRAAGVNRPQGREYAKSMNELLGEHPKLADEEWLDKWTRAACLNIAEYEGAIVEWRKSLPPARRAAMNTPRVVWREWMASTREPDIRKPPRPQVVEDDDIGNGDLAGLGGLSEGRIASQAEEIKRLQGVVERQDAEIARLHGVIEDLQGKLAG